VLKVSGADAGEGKMRIFAVLAAIAATMMFDVRPSLADGPWCAVYANKDNGVRNCGFYSLVQCRATASSGGFCEHIAGPRERWERR
jgi:hypothetical protein